MLRSPRFRCNLGALQVYQLIASNTVPNGCFSGAIYTDSSNISIHDAVAFEGNAAEGRGGELNIVMLERLPVVAVRREEETAVSPTDKKVFWVEAFWVVAPAALLMQFESTTPASFLMQDSTVQDLYQVLHVEWHNSVAAIKPFRVRDNCIRGKLALKRP